VILLDFADRALDVATVVASTKAIFGDVGGLLLLAGAKATFKVIAAKIRSHREGGYTGDGPVEETAGTVEYGEFVSNAASTRRNRPLLELLNDGYSLDEISPLFKAPDEPPASGGVQKHVVEITGDVEYSNQTLRIAIQDLIELESESSF